jgi:hypothetical protein
MSDRLAPSRARRLAATFGAVAAVVLATVFLRDDSDPDPDPAVSPSNAASTAPPRAVSDEEFCTAFEQMNIAFGEMVSDPSLETTRGLKDATAEVDELIDGTTMSDSAKAGARFVSSAILRLDDVADGEDIAAIDGDATIDDTANAKALGEHVAATCVAAPERTPK